MPIKSWHGYCRYRCELIIFGGFLGLNMIVSIPRESRADFFLCVCCGGLLWRVALMGCVVGFFCVILREV